MSSFAILMRLRQAVLHPGLVLDSLKRKAKEERVKPEEAQEEKELIKLIDSYQAGTMPVTARAETTAADCLYCTEVRVPNSRNCANSYIAFAAAR